MSAATQSLANSPNPSTGFAYQPCEDAGSTFSVDLVLLDTMLPARLRMDRVWTDDELIRFGSKNPLVRFEQEPNGDITIMTPVGSRGSERETDVVFELELWARGDKRGRSYSSNGGFRLPDGSMRAADAAWVSWGKIRAVPSEQTSGFYPLCPEFVIEVRSESDSLNKLREKMEQWLANGCELAWLIDPSRKAVEIYRPNQQPESQEGHTAVYGEGPVAGFVLELARIWS